MVEIELVQYDEKYNTIQLGYYLGKAFRGNGYMQEAIDIVLKFVFEELNVEQVYALILNDNISSQKVVLSNNLEYSKLFDKTTFCELILSFNINAYTCSTFNSSKTNFNTISIASCI